MSFLNLCLVTLGSFGFLFLTAKLIGHKQTAQIDSRWPKEYDLLYSLPEMGSNFLNGENLQRNKQIFMKVIAFFFASCYNRYRNTCDCNRGPQENQERSGGEM